MKDISYKIRRLRELQNLTQQYFADQLGISQRAYSKIENGQTCLSVERLCAIAAILGCPVSVLFSLTAEEIYLLHLLKKPATKVPIAEVTLSHAQENLVSG